MNSLSACFPLNQFVTGSKALEIALEAATAVASVSRPLPAYKVDKTSEVFFLLEQI